MADTVADPGLSGELSSSEDPFASGPGELGEGSLVDALREEVEDSGAEGFVTLRVPVSREDYAIRLVEHLAGSGALPVDVRVLADAELPENHWAVERQADLEAEQAALDAEDGEPEEEREPAPPAPSRDDSTIPPDQIVVRGTAKRRKWGGKEPTSTQITLKDVKFEVDGTFRRGERVKFEGVMLVTGEAVKDKLDKDTRQVTDAVEVVTATCVDFQLAE